jgi:hypothetical protein
MLGFVILVICVAAVVVMMLSRTSPKGAGDQVSSDSLREIWRRESGYPSGREVESSSRSAESASLSARWRRCAVKRNPRGRSE